ncbi:MAG TPA: hypothetical protein VGD54_09545 [Steroidobacteraceae bacterium]
MPTDANTRSEILDKSVETTLRGAALKGSGQGQAVSPTPADPDLSVILDGEENTLYSDGLQIDDERDALLGTDGDPLP